MLRVLTWNMAKRPGALKFLMPYLEQQDIDVALLQETPSADAYRDGWDSVWVPGSAPDCRILARPGLYLQQASPGPLSVFGHYAATATVEVPSEGSLLLASIHALARRVFTYEFGEAGVEKFPGLDGAAWLSDLAMRVMPKWAQGERFIAGCDLNTSRRWAAGRLFDEAQARGIFDVTMRCWQEPRPSFFTGRSFTHQLDYIFADERTTETSGNAVLEAEVSQVQRVSDHAPIFIDFFT